VNGKKLSPAKVLANWNRLGGKHGIGAWIWSRTATSHEVARGYERRAARSC